MASDRLYRVGAGAIRALLRLPFVQPVTWASKVWLRHARTIAWLRTMDFDGVIDGGANVGEFASLVKMALPRADLVCVEPHAESAALLRREGYRVIEAALWNVAGELQLVQPTDASTSCTVVAEAEGRPTWRVRATRLDAVDIGGKRVLVKLDLQGAEAQALEGMGALWDRCAALLLEVSIGTRGTYETLRAMLASRGFHEYSTINELEQDGRVIEADKIWLRDSGR